MRTNILTFKKLVEKYFKKYIKKYNKYLNIKKYVLKDVVNQKRTRPGVARFVIVCQSIIY